MFYIIFAVLFCGLAFHEILEPICRFLNENAVAVFIIACLLVGIYCFFSAKKVGSPVYGVGAFFAISQLLVFAYCALFAVVDVMCTEDDPVMATIMALIIGGIMGAYGGFNLTMVKNALTEGKTHMAYPWIVGAVGWIVLIILCVM